MTNSELKEIFLQSPTQCFDPTNPFHIMVLENACDRVQKSEKPILGDVKRIIRKAYKEELEAEQIQAYLNKSTPAKSKN